MAAFLFCAGAGQLFPQEKVEGPSGVAARENLFRNGDFEDAGNTEDWPKDWGSWAPQSGKTWEKGSVGRFMRLASQKPGQLQVLYRELKLEPGKWKAFRAGLRYRISGLKAGEKPGEDARALFVFRDRAGKILDSNSPPLLFSSRTKDWTGASGRILVPENASTCIFVAGLFRAAAGTVDLDKVEAMPLAEEEASQVAEDFPPVPQVSAASWVTNPTFSEPDRAGKWPKDWGQLAPGMSWEREEGLPFVRLVSQEPGRSLMLYKEVPLKKGVAGIELTIRFRTDGVLHGQHEWFDARTIVHFLTANRDKAAKGSGTGGGDFVFTHKPGKTDWIERTKSYIVPEDAATLQLMSGLFQAKGGTVDLAEIRVSPMTEPNAERLKIVNEAYRIWKDDENAATERRVTVRLDEQLQATGNLVSNGGFEMVDKNGGPLDWGKLDVEKGISWEEEKGEHFMRLAFRSPEKTTMLYRMVPLKLGLKGIEVTFRYRTSGLVQGEGTGMRDARAVLHFMDGTRVGHLENGKNLEPDAAAIIFSPKAAEWTVVTRQYPVPEGATKLQLMPALWSVKSGTLDIAEIRVRPMNDEDASAMLNTKKAELQKKEERKAIIDKELALQPATPQLKVSGNRLIGPDGKAVWLQGLCVDSMQWSYGENVLWSIRTAAAGWKANVIRLPVSPEFWFGKGAHQKPGSEEEYRKQVDQAIQLAAGKGIWVALDLHTFGAPGQKHLAFWKDAGARYKNNPAVLYELFNEPHGISWEIWRDGGDLAGPKNKNTDVNPVENKERTGDTHSTGMQALVDAIRGTGAKNIIIAGGLDWGYDLSGVVNGYALNDRNGNGIMYSSHIYPWKKDWQGKVLEAAARHPIFVGEVGTPPDYSSFQFIPEGQRYPVKGWAEDILGMMQKEKLNWTGFSFHPKCGPMVILDWNYTPTPYWGVFVKKALAGESFQMGKMR